MKILFVFSLNFIFSLRRSISYSYKGQLKKKQQLQKPNTYAEIIHHAAGQSTHHSHEKWIILWRIRKFFISRLDFMDFYWNHLNEINFSKNKNQNSFRCMCQSEYVCLKTDDDLSVSAYVYRCRQLKKDGDTNSSWFIGIDFLQPPPSVLTN